MVEREGVFPTARKMMPPLSLFPEKKGKEKGDERETEVHCFAKKMEREERGDEKALAQFVHLVTFHFCTVHLELPLLFRMTFGFSIPAKK